jgi:excisionase family DNA binding protein
MKAPDGYLSAAEAAKRYGINKHTVYRWIKRGVLEVQRVGLHYVFVSEASMERMTMGRAGEVRI